MDVIVVDEVTPTFRHGLAPMVLGNGVYGTNRMPNFQMINRACPRESRESFAYTEGREDLIQEILRDIFSRDFTEDDLCVAQLFGH